MATGRGTKPSTWEKGGTYNISAISIPAEKVDHETLNPLSYMVDWRNESKRFEDFGLGRGVDITDPSPFKNKTTVQVCSIDSSCSNIVCTDEGNALHSIFTKIETFDTNAIQLSGSVTLPDTPILIGAAVELSRTTMRRGYTLGRKVVTRRVAFRRHHHPDEPKTGFKITEWDQPMLLKFIEEHGITHYVSSIQLGAAEYCTMSEGYYSRVIKGKASVGVDKIVELALTASKEHRVSSHVSETKRLGSMCEKGMVRRGTYEEAVLDVQLTPIHTLIKEKPLKDALNNALCQYIKRRASLQDINCNDEVKELTLPPNKHEARHKYAICCSDGTNTFYLDIHNASEVIAWKLYDSYSTCKFFNLQCTETPGEFIIMAYKSSHVKAIQPHPKYKYDFWPTPRFLKVNTHLGYNLGPLHMEDSVEEYHCRLTLRPRLFHEDNHGTINDFTNGKDTFYICTSRRRGKTGYLYVKDRGEINTTDIGPGSMKGRRPIIQQSGGTITAQHGGTIKAEPESVIFAERGSTIEAEQEGSINAQQGGTIIAQRGGTIVAQRGGTIVAQRGGTIVAKQGNNIIAGVGVTIIAQHDRTIRTVSPVGDITARPRSTAQRNIASPRPRYILACKPSIKGGNLDDLMLFRLVRYENTYAMPESKETSV